MTKISYISGIGAGIPVNEYRDRGVVLPKPEYIPFTRMSQGQFQLAVLRNQALATAAWSGDPNMLRAANMLQNALRAGINGYRVTGPMSDPELWAARVIANSMPKTAPVVKNASAIGDLIAIQKAWVRANRAFVAKYYNVLVAAGYTDLIQKANSAEGYPRKDLVWQVLDDNRIGAYDRDRMRNFYDGEIARFEGLEEVEKVYNEYLPKAAHHVLYFPIKEAYPMPERVFSKRLLHTSGIDGLSATAETTPNMVRLWVGSSIQTTNMGGGVGNLDPLATAFGVAGANSDALLAKYKSQFGVNGQPHVGVPVAVVLAIISLVAAAVKAAESIVTNVQKTKQQALTQAKGFGTPALSAATTDWTTSAGGGSTTGNNNTLLLLGAAAAGAYLLTQD